MYAPASCIGHWCMLFYIKVLKHRIKELMKGRRRFRITYTKGRIGIIHWIDIGLLIFMFVVFIRDSFVYDLPFYYILSILTGFVIGRMMTARQKLNAESTLLGVIIMLLLLGIRFFAGEFLINMHGTVSAPALYLLFAGIYYAILRNALSQMKNVYTQSFSTANSKA